MRAHEAPPDDFLSRDFLDANSRHELEGVRKTSAANQADVETPGRISSGQLRRPDGGIGDCVARDGPAAIAGVVTATVASLFDVTAPETQVNLG